MTAIRITRRRVATILSVFYLALLTALAAYALRQSHHYSLPISNTLTSFTLALPLLSGICLETSTALAHSMSSSRKFRHRHASNIPAVLLPSTLTILALVVYSTVVATLAGAHMSPVGSLSCALRERWQHLFSRKMSREIRAIQDGLTCCGFHGVLDMPWPFPEARSGIDAHECSRRFPERTGCQAGWMELERGVAGCILGVAIGTFIWMATIVAIPAIHPTWARESLRLPSSSTSSDQHNKRRSGLLESGIVSGGGPPVTSSSGINDTNGNNDYHDDDDSDDDIDYSRQQGRILNYDSPYRDNPGETEQDRQDRLREIAALNNDSRLAVHVERSREGKASRLMREVGGNEWADRNQ